MMLAVSDFVGMTVFRAGNDLADREEPPES